MRLLLVKTSSLGDVIHNLPVASDIAVQFPGAAIDWVVEEALTEIPRLHPAIHRVIPVALRRWRKQLISPATWREMASFRRTLQAESYDAVIDTQGLLKSALICRMAHGPRYGHSAEFAREPFASRFYDHRIPVPAELHAVTRNRLLASQALAYPLPDRLDYGIAVPPAPTSDADSVTLLTATSRDDKLWPSERWVALGQALHEQGLTSLLPAGSVIERERATKIAAQIPHARVLPPMDLRELAVTLAGSRLVVGVDTGLVHLAAALGRPTIALFCASNPTLTGVLSSGDAINLGQRDDPPSVDAVLGASHSLLACPA
jgi:heptosyltransferase-1